MTDLSSPLESGRRGPIGKDDGANIEMLEP